MFDMAYNGHIDIFLPTGLIKEPKFSKEQRMAESMSFCGLESNSYRLFIDPFTPDFTSIGTTCPPFDIT